MTNCDEIIRQHKTACLRVTSLLPVKDMLWIGTSAGVLVTLTLPSISSSTTSLASSPALTPVPHGHTGHVRFLTCVEMSPDTCRSISGLHVVARNMPRMLVISGGDGYEDFSSNGSNELAGREDSTNHLLLWLV